MSVLFKILRSDNSKTTILIRLMVGVVFLSEGLQKFLYPMINGTGRFEKIGLPSPDFLAPVVGTFESACGFFILIGFLTRLASVPLFVIMIVALISTKLELLELDGFWAMLHASRTDWAMLIGSLFLLIKGGGEWSVDKKIERHASIS